MDNDGDSLCGSPSLNRTTDERNVRCDDCQRILTERAAALPVDNLAEPVVCEVKEDDQPAPPKRWAGRKLTHYAPAWDNVTACGEPAHIYKIDEWGTTDAIMVTCPACIGALTRAKCAEPVICSVKEEDRPALEAAIADAARKNRPVLMPEGVSVTQNPLFIRIGNVEIVGMGKETTNGIPVCFRVLVNGKEVSCKRISMEWSVHETWQVQLGILPTAEEKGGE